MCKKSNLEWVFAHVYLQTAPHAFSGLACLTHYSTL